MVVRLLVKLIKFYRKDKYLPIIRTSGTPVPDVLRRSEQPFTQNRSLCTKRNTMIFMQRFLLLAAVLSTAAVSAAQAVRNPDTATAATVPERPVILTDPDRIAEGRAGSLLPAGTDLRRGSNRRFSAEKLRTPGRRKPGTGYFDREDPPGCRADLLDAHQPSAGHSPRPGDPRQGPHGSCPAPHKVTPRGRGPPPP